MVNLTAGFIGYYASSSLGLPKHFGIYWGVASAVVMTAAAYYIPSAKELFKDEPDR